MVGAGFSVLERELADKCGEKARMIHMVIHHIRRNQHELKNSLVQI